MTPARTWTISSLAVAMLAFNLVVLLIGSIVMLGIVSGMPVDAMVQRIFADKVGLLEYLGGVLGLFLVSVLIWWPLLRRLRRRLAELSVTTARIAAGEFIAAPRSEDVRELAELAAGIDDMSSRLRRIMTGQKRFVADVAHELCSPLARLQMALGILEERIGLDACVELREQATQLSELTQELLMFSRAAAGTGSPARLVAVPLRELTERIVSREGSMATVDIRIPSDLVVRANAALLGRALANVVRNAVRYASASGPIVILASARSDARVELIISDMGPGVPDEALSMLGNPFYRPEPSRSRDSGGTGLGLAIVRTCISACGGTVAFANRDDDAGHRTGFEVVVTLNVDR